MTIRAAQVEDLAAMEVLEIGCFAEAWNQESLREAVSGSHNFALVAEREGEFVGFGAAWTLFEEGEITRVCVAPSARGQGVGRELTLALMRECGARGALTAFLEVRASNHEAQRLYEKLGFVVCGSRPNYYAGGESAVLMRRAVEP